MKQEFGKTKEGQECFLYSIENENGMKLVISDLGATIVSLLFHDKNGETKDLVLGYDSPNEYEEHTCFFGATIGRNANRIDQARCTIDGKEYTLEANDYENNLHSGSHGFHNMVWTAIEPEEKSNSLTFTYLSKDREQDFPGNMQAKVTYELTNQNEILISYEATTDKATIANFTNHAYYNLNGHDAGTIEEHKLVIYGSKYTPIIDNKAIPTGAIADAQGTPMDFSKMKSIGQDIRSTYEQLAFADGYDHNYVLDQYDGSLALVSKVKSEQSGIAMELYSDYPGVQFYAGNMIGDQIGKNGVQYRKRQAFCLEPQYFPNAINEPEFTMPLLYPGQRYEKHIKVCLSVEK